MLETAQPQRDHPHSGSLLKHFLLADLTEARHILETPETDLDRAIHLARRRLKRVRTLFLILKPMAGSGHEHRAEPVRQAFQQLSGARDADAMLKASVWLSEKAGAKTKQPALALVDMVKLHALGRHNHQTPIAEITRLLRIAESEAASLAAEPDSIGLLRDGLIKTYQKGRKLYHAALDAREEDDETLHDWRKQVKHRMHIDQVIAESALQVNEPPMKDLDRLSEYLGEEHDFENLGVWMCGDAFTAEPRDLAHLTAAISRRRVKLTNRALEIGHELYGMKSARFVRDLEIRQ